MAAKNKLSLFYGQVLSFRVWVLLKGAIVGEINLHETIHSFFDKNISQYKCKIKNGHIILTSDWFSLERQKQPSTKSIIIISTVVFNALFICMEIILNFLFQSQ